MDIQALNDKLGIPGVLRFTSGAGGFTLIEIETILARACISVYGGQVLSYRPREAADDLLFLGERAFFESGREIKGGIPVCWPWFGRDRGMPDTGLHGFARLHPWSVRACETLADGTVRVRLGLADDEATRAIWPHYFNLWVDILVGRTLKVVLVTRNAGDAPMRLTQGLHTYFKVGDPRRVEVHGLEGCGYVDKAVGGGDAEVLQEGALTFGSEVNRIYEGVPSELAIEDASLGRRIRILTEQSSTAVVWNPWSEIARAMEDLDDDDYLRFICVETVNTASEVIEIPPRGDCRLSAEYRIENR